MYPDAFMELIFCKYYMKLGQQVEISTVYSKAWHVRHAFKTISEVHFSVDLQMQFCVPFAAACIGRTVQCTFHTYEYLMKLDMVFLPTKLCTVEYADQSSSFNVYTFILFFMRCIFN